MNPSEAEEKAGKIYEMSSGAERERGLAIAIVDADFERGNAVSSILCTMRPNGVIPRVTRLTGVENPFVLKNQGLDVVMIALDGDKDRAMRTIEALGHAEGMFLIVYAEHADGDLLIRCMRAGVREFLHYPFEQGILEDAFQRRELHSGREQDAKKPVGKLFVFLGAKGGSGVSTTACNFALELAIESERKTILVDLDLPLGDAALFLGVRSEFSTLNALSQGEDLDATYLSKLLTRHESGLQVLGAPGRYLRVPPPGSQVDQLLVVACSAFEYVVVDAGARLELLDTRLFEMASTIYLVTQVGVAELRNSNRLITECLQDFDDKLEVVLNRYSGEVFGIDDKAIEGALTRPAQWKIPNDYRAVSRMQNTAEPLQSSQIRRAFKRMVAAATGGSEQEPKRKTSLLGLLSA